MLSILTLNPAGETGMAEATINWNDPTRDRRRHDTPGRRARDYDTCHYHDGQCDRVELLERSMVGWRTFNLVVGGLGAAIVLVVGMLWNINMKVDSLGEKLSTLTIEMKTHTAAGEKK